jgi:CubicO group peptidase (beta-lactamase class C family)
MKHLAITSEMGSVTRRSVLIGAAALSMYSTLQAGEASEPEGVWSATLVRGSTRLRLRFEFNGQGSVQLVSVDQGNAAFAGQAIARVDRLTLKFRDIHATYAARRVAADRFEGTWDQTFETPLVMVRGEVAAAPPEQAVSPLTQDELDALRRQCGAPAMAAAVTARTRQALNWASGRRAIGPTSPVTTLDHWHLGSITKSMTATLVARLVDLGYVTWDMHVGDVLGAVAPRLRATYRDATFRHLLSHRAALPADLSTMQLLSFLLGNGQEIRAQRRRFVQLALQADPVAELAAQYHYSNCGYVVAGAMLESVTGRSWEDLMTEHLFRPLGLHSAGFGPPHAGAIGELQQPVGHTADVNARLLRLVGGNGLRALRPGSSLQNDNPRVLGPAATVHMSLPDLLTYLSAHRDATSYLRANTWRELHTPPYGGDYALGWVVRPDGSFWHNGSNTFWYAEAHWHPERGFAAAATCNEARAPAMAAVGEALARATAAGMI